MSNPNFNPTLSTDEIWRSTDSSRCLSDDLDVLGIEDTTYPGCYYRIVDGVTEWINPPMVVGNEYRTTERWNGKVVYTMFKHCGATSTRTSTSSPSGATSIIRYNAWCNNKLLPLADYIAKESYYAYTSVDVDGLAVWYNADGKSDGFGCGREQWYVQFWYTKD